MELWGLLPAWEAESPGGDNSGRVADEGNRMVQAYWENVGWMYDCIPRVIFDNDYLPSVYSDRIPPNPHKLAVVYLVMALGVMFDLERREPCECAGLPGFAFTDVVSSRPFGGRVVPLRLSMPDCEWRTRSTIRRNRSSTQPHRQLYAQPA